LQYDDLNERKIIEPSINRILDEEFKKSKEITLSRLKQVLN